MKCSVSVVIDEYTRVQLHKADDVEGSDYVNANYIQVHLSCDILFLSCDSISHV